VLRGEDGTLSGIIVARANGERVELFSLWVEPRLCGRHLGSRLLDWALLWCRVQHPGKSVHLQVNPREAAAIALYVRRGFVFTGESQPLPHGIFEIVVGMRLGPTDGTAVPPTGLPWTARP
jgi:ribosomal protein S18 acetylase RimI-like enzyme